MRSYAPDGPIRGRRCARAAGGMVVCFLFWHRHDMPVRNPSPTGPNCPRCPAEPLRPGRLGRVAVEECAKCGGIWMKWLLFRRVLRSPDLLREAILNRQRMAADPPRDPIACLRCGETLWQIDYDRTGLIIDYCPKMHGVPSRWLNTSGGVAPSTGCSQLANVGAKAFVPYKADYLFYTAATDDADNDN